MKKIIARLIASILVVSLFAPVTVHAAPSLISPAPGAEESAASDTLTAEQIVQLAYALYLQAGLDQNASFSRVQAKLADLLAQHAQLAVIVAEDLKALASASSDGAAAAASGAEAADSGAAASADNSGAAAANASTAASGQNSAAAAADSSAESAGQSSAAAGEPAGQSAAAAGVPAGEILTPEQIVQKAFELYMQAGFDQNVSFERVQAILTKLISQQRDLAAVAAVVVEDVNAYLAQQVGAAGLASADQQAQAAGQASADQQAQTAGQASSEQPATTAEQASATQTAEAAQTADQQAVASNSSAQNADSAAAAAQNTAGLTTQQVVDKALALYVQAGLDPVSAIEHVQAKMAEMIAHPENIESIVKEEISSVTGVNAAALTPEEIVRQAFAHCIESGMTTEQAMEAVQANLSALLNL